MRLGTGVHQLMGVMLGSSRYSKYIQSPAWSTNPARLAELRLSGGRCRLCNRQQRLTVHHRTYVRLGRESVSDLTTLCHDCHEMVTAELRKRKYSRKRLPPLIPVGAPMERQLIDSTSGWRHVVL